MPDGGSFDLDVRPITFSDVDPDGFLTIQVQLPGAGGTSVSGPIQVLEPYGHFSWPADPKVDVNGKVVPASAASALLIWIGGECFALPVGNPADIANLPNRTKGDVGIAASAGTFVRVRLDGTITSFTTIDGTPTGESIYQEIGPTGRRFVSPFGTETLSAEVYDLVHAGGASFTLGQFFGLPGPLGALESYAEIKAASISLEASIIELGADGASPLVLARVLANFLDAFVTALNPAAGGATALAAAMVAAAASLKSPIVTNEPLFQVLGTKNVLGT